MEYIIRIFTLFILIIILPGCDNNLMDQNEILESNSDNIELQTPKGNFNVGLFPINFYDTSRVEIANPDAVGKRKLYTQIWYPTDEKNKPRNYLGNKNTAKGFEELENEKWLSRLNKVQTNSIVKAKLSDSLKKYPVVLFSAGFGISAYYNTMFLEGLASKGYIVVAIDLPYVNPLVTESGKVINSKGSYWDDFPMTKGIKDYNIGKKKFDFTYDYFTKDYLFIHEKLKELNNHPLFYKALDLDRLASIGHSAGSVPTFGLMMKEENPFKAFVVYDVNLHANYVSENMFFEKNIKTQNPICLFILEYASIPPYEFVTSLNAELSIFVLKETEHNSISDINFIRYSDVGDKINADNSLNSLNKIIDRTVFFLNESLN